MTAQSFSNVVANGTVVTTAETVVAVTPFLAEALAGGGGFLIFGDFNISPGTAATSINIRVRAGSTTAGALISPVDIHTVTAAQPQVVPFTAWDPGGPRAGNQYCVTVQQTAATGNATITDANIVLDVVSPGG